LKYRAEIDGLRAIAIGAVLLFHANLGLSGGYVGVDVFFVISGFLITGLLLKDLDRGDFSILEFWERRIRRILPALAVVIIASVVAGWFLFIPAHFKQLGQSVTAQALLCSNFYFWKQSGYFADDADLKPLFHTWSLAVEEQFYLLFPFLLMLLTRFSRRWLIATLALIASGSFILSVYCSYKHGLANFYLLPMRAWELLLGALLAALPVQRGSIRWLTESLSVVGLLAIVWAAFFYDADTRFPGASALLPCVGTALVIWTNAHALTLVGKLLAARLLVFVGLISYSLYLWHWPLLVFGKYWALDPLTLNQRALLVIAMTVLAILSWKFVETPLRNRNFLARRARIFSFAAVVGAVLLTSGLVIDKMQGVPWRLPAQALQYANGHDDYAFRIDLDLNQVLHDEFIELGAGDKTQPVALLIWGDSHAMAALPVIDALCKEHSVRGVAATHSSQVPLLGYDSRSEGALMDQSIAFNDAVFAFLRRAHVPDVLLIASWNGYVDFEHGTNHLRSAMLRTIPALREAGSRVWIMKPVPRQPWDVPDVLVSAVLAGRDVQTLGVSLVDHRKNSQKLDPIFAGLTAPGVMILDPTDLFLTSAGTCRAAQDGHALYWDTHHLTVHGSMLLRPLFQPIFEHGIAD